jgi:hypothetical protein
MAPHFYHVLMQQPHAEAPLAEHLAAKVHLGRPPASARQAVPREDGCSITSTGTGSGSSMICRRHTSCPPRNWYPQSVQRSSTC